MAGSTIALSALLLPVETQAGKFGNPFRRTTQVEQLAEEIDKLEQHIDESGSVVAKQPDVWGESRLAKHRREVEEQFAKKLCDFSVTLNAAISRSDQAILASATSCSATSARPAFAWASTAAKLPFSWSATTSAFTTHK